MYPNKFHYTEFAMVYVVFEALEYSFSNQTSRIKLDGEISNGGTIISNERMSFNASLGNWVGRDFHTGTVTTVVTRIGENDRSVQTSVSRSELRVGLKVIMIMNQLKKGINGFVVLRTFGQRWAEKGEERWYSREHRTFQASSSCDRCVRTVGWVGKGFENVRTSSRNFQEYQTRESWCCHKTEC